MTITTATSNMMSASWGDNGNLAVACGDADSIFPAHLILFMMIIPYI